MNDNQHIPSGYKPSPLGIIPEDWEVKRLGEIGEVLMCKRIMKYQTDSCGDIPFFKIGTFGGKADAYISREVFDEYKTKYSYPKVGDVLISAAGTIGRSVIFDGTPSYYQDSNIVWIDNDNKQVLNKYLYYYYSTINWITDTGTIPRLYNGALKAIQIPTPPIEQQTRIVSILELWDTAIAKQTALTEQLTLRKRGLMQQLLTGKKRLKGFAGEWKEVRLGEIGKFAGGCVFNEHEQGGIEGVPFYKVSDMNLEGNEIQMTVANNYVTQEQITRLGYTVIDKESIIFAKVGAAIALERKRYAKNFIIDNNMLAFIPNCNPWFMKHWFDSIILSKYIQVGALPSYNASDLAIIKLRLPSPSEQDAITKVLLGADKEIEIQKQKLAAMQEQKKGLMQVLLTGKRRVLYVPQDVTQGGTQGGTQDGTQDGTQGENLDLWIEEQIKKNPNITTEELSKASGKGINTIKRHISKLSHIKYVGSGYSGHWEIDNSK